MFKVTLYCLILYFNYITNSKNAFDHFLSYDYVYYNQSLNQLPVVSKLIRSSGLCAAFQQRTDSGPLGVWYTTLWRVYPESPACSSPSGRNIPQQRSEPSTTGSSSLGKPTLAPLQAPDHLGQTCWKKAAVVDASPYHPPRLSISTLFSVVADEILNQ